jgi:hypothetical protein
LTCRLATSNGGFVEYFIALLEACLTPIQKTLVSEEEEAKKDRRKGGWWLAVEWCELWLCI